MTIVLYKDSFSCWTLSKIQYVGKGTKYREGGGEEEEEEGGVGIGGGGGGIGGGGIPYIVVVMFILFSATITLLLLLHVYLYSSIIFTKFNVLLTVHHAMILGNCPT